MRAFCLHWALRIDAVCHCFNGTVPRDLPRGECLSCLATLTKVLVWNRWGLSMGKSSYGVSCFVGTPIVLMSFFSEGFEAFCLCLYRKKLLFSSTPDMLNEKISYKRFCLRPRRIVANVCRKYANICNIASLDAPRWFNGKPYVPQRMVSDGLTQSMQRVALVFAHINKGGMKQ